MASSIAAAQAEEPPAESVVLLAPAEVRAEWTAALQLELAARGAIAIPADAPEAATSLLGDAEAQRAAIERGARVAVWVEARAGSWRLRMIAASAERAHVVPVARDADARTVALIVVSLLDAGAEPGLDEAPSIAAPSSPEREGAPSATAESTRAASAGPRAQLASPTPAEGAERERANAADTGRLPRGEPYVRWSGLIGLSGLVLAKDTRADFGGTVRAGIAMRYAWFELAVLHDLGFYVEQSRFAGAQPYGRVCVEAGAATPRTTAAFHAGGRGCFGSLFALETQGGFGGGEIFISHGPRTHISGGGYFAVSFQLHDTIRLFVRADVEVAWTDFAVFDSIDAVPAPLHLAELRLR
ncbi:MAG: hypothetical protein M5U28_37505 [Sandaracinaceae bacterium]|nr:hypothetical protein [Sandaracinaceae bacterium]